jgi:hypothetical protein
MMSASENPLTGPVADDFRSRTAATAASRVGGSAPSRDSASRV